MLIALNLIAILWIALGVLLILYTEPTKKVLEKVFYTEHVRWLAVLPLVIGSILIVGGLYYPEMFLLALVLGGLGVAKGVYLVVGPIQHVKGLLQWWFYQASDRTLRLFGLITFVIGVALLSFLL